MIKTTTLADKVRAQAKGTPATEAAAMIITRAIGGRLLDQLPLAWNDDHIAEIDWATTRTELGYLSGGEHKILNLAISLATEHPVNLNNTLTGLDDNNARIVLQAMAHVMGVRLPGGLL